MTKLHGRDRRRSLGSLQRREAGEEERCVR